MANLQKNLVYIFINNMCIVFVCKMNFCEQFVLKNKLLLISACCLLLFVICNIGVFMKIIRQFCVICRNDVNENEYAIGTKTSNL